MEELTIGQRIAQQRKKQNLSQMGLASQLEVSRQAISKWESDGAIPEIDKLIALSRLFGVSIGWLLGVEEEPLSHPDVLSEDQLRILEELVKKYQISQKPQPAVLPYLLAIAASLLIFLLMYGRMDQISRYSEEISVLSERMEKLESSGSTSHTLNVDTLLANYTLTPSAPVIENDSHLGRGISTVSFQAIPHGWHPGNECWLHIQNAAGETRRAKCQWNGISLAANIQLPVEDGYEYSFVVKHTDGSQEIQVLWDETAQNLQSTFHIPGVHETGTMEYHDGTMILKGYTSTLTQPEFYQKERFEEPGYYTTPFPASWQKAEYVLLVNDSVSGAAYYHLPVMDCDRELYPEDTTSYTMTTAEPELRFENITVSDTTMHAQLWLYAYLDNGLRERYLLNMFDYSPEQGFSELS